MRRRVEIREHDSDDRLVADRVHDPRRLRAQAPERVSSPDPQGTTDEDPGDDEQDV